LAGVYHRKIWNFGLPILDLTEVGQISGPRQAAHFFQVLSVMDGGDSISNLQTTISYVGRVLQSAARLDLAIRWKNIGLKWPILQKKNALQVQGVEKRNNG